MTGRGVWETVRCEMTKRFVLDLNLAEWEAWVKGCGFPAFRAKQIYQWLCRGVLEPERMSNLPKALLEEMEKCFVLDSMRVARELVSERDGTRKFVFSLYDGNVIESVLMKYKTGYSLCISSQVGCRMGCIFCASSHVAFGRNLSAGEMVGQISRIADRIGERIHSVVVMGLGEAFDNYENFLAFLRLAMDSQGINLGARHITVSTCGLVPQMIEFMGEHSQVNLAVSLHAATDEQRGRIMPIAKAFKLAELLPVCEQYARTTGRRITFEYSLFRDVNDSDEDAKRLVSILRGIHCHVNLIAANEFPGSPVRRSTPERVQTFRQVVEKSGIPVTLRREMGSDIMAACGQLRRGIETKDRG